MMNISYPALYSYNSPQGRYFTLLAGEGEKLNDMTHESSEKI